MDSQVVSIIVPVYNVYEYLNQCIDSLVHQTYVNIEILLLNDGSNDGSAELCEFWANKDSRICYISKKNEGLSATRNLGISLAKGKYVMFVDSDDWVDIQFVEKMYQAIRRNDADMAECDFWRLAVDSNIKSYNANNDFVGHDFTKQERIIWGNSSIWKIISKRSLWIDNQIEMPSIPMEDLAVYALLVASARKIVSVRIPLYYYRKYRNGSISFNKMSFLHSTWAMQYIIDGFKRLKMFETYHMSVYRQILRWMARYLVPSLTKLSTQEYHQLEQMYKKFLFDNFPLHSDIQLIVFGSYNLTRIANKLLVLENPYHRFQFSSIIGSVMEKPSIISGPHHQNPYREYMLRREFKHELFNVLAEDNLDYIILDFIEERHDILQVDNLYYTKSDALVESDFLKKGRTILRESVECQELWKRSCLIMIAKLKKYFKADHIILIENYLSEWHGDIHHKERYENTECIAKQNEILKGYYKFFRDHYEGIQIIDLSRDWLYFTDDRYEYGCYPWHLNELINIKISQAIHIEKAKY